MPNLSCDVTSCGYNAQNLCSRQGIKVGGQQAISSSATKCESFLESTGAFTNSTAAPNFTLSVACEAKNCTYNEAGNCEAETISIDGSLASVAAETKCGTFVPKF